MSPAEFKECSPWEFQAAVDGWLDANTPDEGGGYAMSDAEKDDLWEWMQSKPETMH